MKFSAEMPGPDTGTSESPAVAFVTLGCPKNEVDSDRMAALLLSSGYTVTDDPDEADAVIVNTCGFLADATEQSIVTALELVQDEAGGRPVIMAGCAVSRYGEDLASQLPEIAEFVPVLEEGRIVEIVAGCVNPNAPSPRTMDADLETRSDARLVPGPSSYIKVADGCDRTCAFCAIPLIRGEYVSKPLDRIVAEAGMLAAAGAREIVLIAQDTTYYGREGGQLGSISDVIRAVTAIDDVQWVRVMYMQPNGVTDELLASMAGEPKVVPYIEMPLQHASARLLRAMHRSGGGSDFRELIERIRGSVPSVALRTTIIVGFPGETDEEFEELLQFLRDAQFDYVGVFAYSQEEGTAAAELPDQVDEDTKRDRQQRAIDLADEIGWHKAEQRVGSQVQVLVLGYDDEEGAWWGRTPFQAPDIDGVTYLYPADGAKPSELSAGDFVIATVVDSVLYDLIAEVQP